MICIIDTGIGNVKGIQNMLKRLSAESIISNDNSVLDKADALILPGIGTFDHGMLALRQYGLVEFIKRKALYEKTKILGICLGMQLLANCSEEGSEDGLGLIGGEVKKFNFTNDNQKVPHMGWNLVEPVSDSALLRGFESSPRFYFTHSFYFLCQNDRYVVGQTNYGANFCSVVHKENIMGVQFHPEKSHRFGLKLFQNFISC
jgi:imidazole glycerol-phosphate synthase subunit HisH